MSKAMLFAIGLGVLLAGCASGRVDPGGRSGYMRSFVTAPDPARPNVFVTDDRFLVVDQEPIVLRQKSRDAVSINWALDKGSPYVFVVKDPKDPIEAKPIFGEPLQAKCELADGGKALACAVSLPGKGKYSYTLRIRNAQSGKDIVSDPTIFNDP